MSDRVLVMREGRLVAELSRAEATQERVIQAAAGIVARMIARVRATQAAGDRRCGVPPARDRDRDRARASRSSFFAHPRAATS